MKRPFRVAILVKQVPQFEALALGPDGRLVRDGLAVEMNPYCRRAVSAGVALAREHSGTATVFTLGPPAAIDVLREAVAWGADRGVLVTDSAFAGSDTLATARALAAAVQREGAFDLVLVGRNSVDADTGQVGPQLAELLDLGFVGGARTLTVDDGVLTARLEHDDGYVVVEAELPIVASCAERLCEPCKVEPDGRLAVAADLITTVSASDLGAGPWGVAGSPTRVGATRMHDHRREKNLLDGTLKDQVQRAVEMLRASGAMGGDAGRSAEAVDAVSAGAPVTGSCIAVVIEPGRARTGRELLGAAAALGIASGRRVVAILLTPCADLSVLSSWGADEVMLVEPRAAAEDVAAAMADWASEAQPWAVLMPSTMWGRELAARLAVRLGAGLTGDAIDLEIVDDCLVGWKPAFGGQLVAAITSDSPVQLVTVRPGVLPVRAGRTPGRPGVSTLATSVRGRVRVVESSRDDDVEILASAKVVVGIGAGVPLDLYPDLDRLATSLGGTLAASRKVTDREGMPRARQVGITGRSIAPDLYIAVGISGRFNHMVGVRAAGTVVAINSDPAAPIFDQCDIGIVGDITEVLPILSSALETEASTAGVR
jgi:electron transfer flavoprotein alpha subunit